MDITTALSNSRIARFAVGNDPLEDCIKEFTKTQTENENEKVK